MISSMARKHYTEEFRRQAVDLYEQTEGATLSGIAGGLELDPGHVGRLGRTIGSGTTAVPAGSPAAAAGIASSEARPARGPCSGAGSREDQAHDRTGDFAVGGEVFRRRNDLVSRLEFAADHRHAFEVKRLCQSGFGLALGPAMLPRSR